MNRDSWSINFWNGIDSGFPVCCVMFYCDVWLNLRKSKTMFAYNESNDYDTGVGYLQCPDCVLRGLKNAKTK